MATCVLFFFASIVGGVINAIAGGGGLITFPLLAGRWANDCRCDKRGGWVRLVSDGSLAYPKSVNRSSGSRMVMASRHPQSSRWIDWSAAIVIVIGLTVTAYYFWKLYNPAVMPVGGE